MYVSYFLCYLNVNKKYVADKQKCSIQETFADLDKKYRGETIPDIAGISAAYSMLTTISK